MSTTSGEGPPRRVVAGRYVLRGLLGQGGMADVELAYDEVLDRQVAVKMLHERYAGDASFIDRFRREAQSAAALNHPNVVGIYDTGTDRGRPFIVMEYIAGRSLRDVLRREGVLPNRAAEIAAEAAAALHFAHERGIVHRDIKPANIMISDDGRVKVTDFGIARAVNAESVTQTAAVFGTAAYVAPEQAQGQAVDGRTDIYALGCVLYEMLTGRQPFTGDSPVTLAYKHVSEDPVPPSQVNPDVSPAMEAVVLKAMAKAPAQRYQSAKEFEHDLRRVVAGQAVHATPTAAYATTQAIPRTAPATAAPHDPTLVATRPPAPRREEYYEEPPRGGGAGRIAAYIFLVLLVIALAAVAAFLFSDLFGDDDPAVTEVTVPTGLIGLDIEQAQEILVAAGLSPRLGEPEHDPEAPPNTVLRLDPPEGTVVPEGSTVIIIRSAGPELVPIPQVQGLTQAEAEQVLFDAGLVVGAVEEEEHPTIPEGQVIRTQPVAGIEVERGTEVTLIVSGGSQSFVMPDVFNLTEEDARRRIETACAEDPPCAVVQVRETFDDDVAEGRAVRTQPPAGEEVGIGDIVTLYISQGSAEPTETPEPTPSPTPTPTPPAPPTVEPTSTPTPPPPPDPPPPAPEPPPPAPQPPPPAPPPPPPTGEPTTRPTG